MRSVSYYNSLLKINELISNYLVISINMPIQNMYMAAPNFSMAKRMRYGTLVYGMSWIRVVILPALPSWNALLSQITFIHNYKNQIILHINIDFHYKAMYQLVSLLFSLQGCMSLNKNDDWCPFASSLDLVTRSRV